MTALPRAAADGGTVAGLRADPAVRGRSSAQSAPNVSFARLAWFDLNGDGHIDPRSAAAGGDATLLVPAHAVDLPTYARTVSVAGGHPVKAADDGRPVAPGNAAQTNRAVDAYQRYGQTPPAPSAPVAPAGASPEPAAVTAPESAVA